MFIYQKYNYFIFDLDGTIYRGNKIIPFAAETINQLKRLGKKILFVSNKTTESAFDYYLFLKNSGFEIEENQIITSTTVICNYLNNNFSHKKIFAIAEQNFINELSENNIFYTNDLNEIDIVIITLDRTFNYEKLEIAAKAIEQGAHFFAANIDDTCPVEQGEVFDAGSIISALEKRTKRKLELNFGKPSKFMIEEIKNRIDFETTETLIVGDRLETDILMGNIMGIDSALVATGVKNSTNGNCKAMPTYNLNSIVDLFEQSVSNNHLNNTSF